MSEPSFAVVIPMYNEETGAEKCVGKVTAALRALPERNILIVVNDGSADATRDVLDKIAPQHENLVVIHHERNQGYGRALRTGADRAGVLEFEYVLFMDSDLTNDPVYLPLFVEKMRSGFDVIKASRYMAGGGVDDVPWWRVWISRAGNALARRLFRISIHDCTNGFRAVRTSLFRTIQFRENRFAIIMEELYHSRMRGCTFAEVPNRLRNRSADLRPTSFSYKPSTFWQYLKYPLKAWLRIPPPARL